MQKNKYNPQEYRIAPWLKSYGEVPFHLDYPDFSMVSALFRSADQYPKQSAISFQNRSMNFAELKKNIIIAAKSLSALGINKGDRVTICMPNIPQAVLSLYAVNYIGAVASMIHPLSAVHEIAFYLKETKSKTILTIDQFYSKVEQVRKSVKLEHIIVAKISDELSFFKKIAYRLLKESKFPEYKEDSQLIKWNRFLKLGKKSKLNPYIEKKGKDVAVVLFSGGTTGTSKGIQLTNLNFNALAMQTSTMCNKRVQGTKMLAAMPMFHAFGLGVCIHTMMFCGGESILVPQVSIKGYSQLLKTVKPNYIAGVPTLFEGITRNTEMEGVDLSCLMGVFSGGDNLPVELKKKIDRFLADHGATVRVREGYGTTECCAASCLTPYENEREGSIGLPYPDTYYGIFTPGTSKKKAFGKEGEICLHGPSVMKGYIGHKEDNASTLVKHDDGFTWLHTGDMGYMDKDGYVYFSQRIKRMIVTSGYNVYPSQIENVINSIEEVQMSCVIGVPDSYKMHKIKAFVVLKQEYTPSDEVKKKILEFCKERVAKYAMPYDIEFRNELPLTLIGKIAYRVLEDEEKNRLSK